MAAPEAGTVFSLAEFGAYLESLVPAGGARTQLATSVLPSLISAVADVAEVLQHAHQVSQVGTANAFGDDQLNVDVAGENAIRAALAKCPSVVTASSEEEPVETPTGGEEPSGDERYTLAFDPVDGSSIIAPNWSVGAILGVWDGNTALGSRSPRDGQVATVLGVLGPRTTALVAIRCPGQSEGVCLEIGISRRHGSEAQVTLVRSRVRLHGAGSIKQRYFQPANTRLAPSNPAYVALITHYLTQKYRLRYSGGLVPDVVHSLVQGHGIYVSPVASPEAATLRRLYELCPVALVVECAGGKAVDPLTGDEILAVELKDLDERGGIICGTASDVDHAVSALLKGDS